MKVFEIAVPEGYEWVVPVDDADFELFRGFDGTSRSEGWTPVDVRTLTEDERGATLREADLPWLGSHVMVLTDRAVAAVGGFLERWGELLPLADGDRALRVFNPRCVIDALDEDASEVVRFDSGRIMAINAPVFRADAIGDTAVFKLPQLLRGSIYVTEPFVELVDSQGLRGTRFEPVWDSASA